MRKVAITGLGVATPLGTGTGPFWEALIAGRSGVRAIRQFDASKLRSRIAGEVWDFEPARTLGAKTIKRAARFTQLALVAAKEAVADSGLAESERENAAVVIGSGIGGFDMLEREHASFLARGPGGFAPLTVPMIIPNMAAGVIAIETSCRGPNMCVSTACATGANSIGTAFDLLRSGRVDVALAGSSESSISPFSVDGYCQLRALSTRNDSPETASRPFSRDRDGFVIAEGSGVVVLEEWERARRRGARIYAELAGYGATADGYHLTAPDPQGRGAVRAMQAALADAGLRPEDIDVINAHGTSTPINDVLETRSIRRVFGTHADRLMVHSTKSMTGHALGGAASVEAVVAALTLHRGVVHPTINLHDPDPECDLDYVPLVAREFRPRAVLSNSFAFGGHNAVLVFRAA
jgi:3-oxoacyl-[acyl-carrier-protein] synthase II